MNTPPPSLDYESRGRVDSRVDTAIVIATVATIADLCFALIFSIKMYDDAKSTSVPGHTDWDGLEFALCGIPIGAIGLLMLTVVALFALIIQRLKPFRSYFALTILMLLAISVVGPTFVYLRFEAR